MSDEEEEFIEEDEINRKKRRVTKNQFIDDEAELSGDDAVSEDESDQSDADAVDLELVDKDAPELDSEEEEEEQLEDKDVSVGQRRRRKFRWQTKNIMDNSLRRHYDPNDDDSQEGDDYSDEDDTDFDELKPRLRRPTADSLLIGSTRVITKRVDSLDMDEDSDLDSRPAISGRLVAGTSSAQMEDSNSNANSRLPGAKVASKTANNGAPSDLSRFLFRDKELVKALSTKETIIVTREEKEKVIDREIKRVLQSKSIFDQLYS